jgi:hypothetical protein
MLSTTTFINCSDALAIQNQGGQGFTKRRKRRTLTFVHRQETLSLKPLPWFGHAPAKAHPRVARQFKKHIVDLNQQEGKRVDFHG